ncbi:Beta-Amyrin Synthase 1 [Vitis vinifera]|uniref:Beta-Amyrin Synthase 1 n=1 Tax=Vitis vinifera TaxID=29760 RepID=A0A438J4D0_VITVI|nr:Beta-Amyrin Synthase 1 [Vitis vinifera]
MISRCFRKGDTHICKLRYIYRDISLQFGELEMWRLKVADGGNDPYIYSTNNFVGRQIWEFDPDYGTPEERNEVEAARENFWKNRYQVKPSSDLLWRMQFLREKNFKQTIPQVKVGDSEAITYETATIALRRGAHFFSALQASDGHWPAENSGPLYFLPPWSCVYTLQGILTLYSPENFLKKFFATYTAIRMKMVGGDFILRDKAPCFVQPSATFVCVSLEKGEMVEETDALCKREFDIYFALNVFYIDEMAHEYIQIQPGTGLLVLRASIAMSTKTSYTKRFYFPLFGIALSWSTFFSFESLNAARMFCYSRMVYMPMSYLYGKRFIGPITPLVLELREELFLQPYNEINWKKVRHLCAKEDLYYPHPLIQDLMWDSLYICTEPLLTRWPFKKLRKKALEVTMKHIHYEDENSRYITIGCVEKVFFQSKWGLFQKHLARIPDYIWVAEDGIKMQSFGSQEWDTSFALQALLACNMTDELGLALKKGHEFIKESQVKDNPSGDFKSMYRHISKGSGHSQIRIMVGKFLIALQKCCLLFSMMAPKIVGMKMEPERLFDSVNILLRCRTQENEIDNFITNAAKYIEDSKCLMAHAAGKTYHNCLAIRRVLSFYSNHKEMMVVGERTVLLARIRSNLVQTGWALMGLLSSGQRETQHLFTGCKALINSQMEDGDFPQQEITGAFMKNCMLHYATYRNTFPLWALAQYVSGCHCLKAGCIAMPLKHL